MISFFLSECEGLHTKADGPSNGGVFFFFFFLSNQKALGGLVEGRGGGKTAR